jgi:hypothetical protein
MSITLDASVNALIQQSQAMKTSSTHIKAQVSLVKQSQSSQEQAVMKLLDSAAGLMTYGAQGGVQSVPAVGTQVNVVA